MPTHTCIACACAFLCLPEAHPENIRRRMKVLGESGQEEVKVNRKFLQEIKREEFDAVTSVSGSLPAGT